MEIRDVQQDATVQHDTNIGPCTASSESPKTQRPLPGALSQNPPPQKNRALLSEFDNLLDTLDFDKMLI
jgi:hypothetical protein